MAEIQTDNFEEIQAINEAVEMLYDNKEEEDILTFCNPLPRYKRPRKIIFDKVPRNPTGKIEKPKLREKYIGGRLVEKETQG